MNLLDLHLELLNENITSVVDLLEERVVLEGSSHFDEYISQNKDGIFKIEVYLRNKTTKDKITRDDFKRCMSRRDELIEVLNNMPLSIKFNAFAESE